MTIYSISLLSVEAIALVMLALWGYAMFAPATVSPLWRVGSAICGGLLFIAFISVIG